MVSSKIIGFQIPESRQKSCLIERIKLDDDGRSEHPFLKSEQRNGCGVAGFWKRTLTALPYRFHFEAICLAGFGVPVRKPESQSAEPFINGKWI
jgi:hypothetical protein